jgi:phytoene dehydrogenase-like protein
MIRRMQGYDAVVVGSGHNALVTAAYLARAGWGVLVLEGNDRPGRVSASVRTRCSWPGPPTPT